MVAGQSDQAGLRHLDRPGSLWTASGALLLLAALFLPVVASDVHNRLGKLRSQGVVDVATVTEKRFVDRERTDFRGLPRPGFSDYYLTLSFDRGSHTPHPEYLRSGTLRSAPGTLRVSQELEVPGPHWDRAREGDTIAVTFLPARMVFDKDSLQLTEIVEEQGSDFFQICLWLAAMLSLISGGLCLWRGWHAGRRL